MIECGRACPLKPKDVGEVQDIVMSACEADLTVSVIGGNHSGYGGLGRVVIDMRSPAMSEVQVDKEAGTVKAGGGATLGEIAKAATQAGLAVPLGTVSSVGIGLVLQGGVGHLGRSLGLTLDHIINLEVVTPDGTIHQLHDESDELFWAMRGCGPNFGVVSSVTFAAAPYQGCAIDFRMFQCPPQIVEGTSLLRTYLERCVALPRHCSSDGGLFFGQTTQQFRIGVFDFNYGPSSPNPVKMPAPAEVLSMQSTKNLDPCELMDLEPSMQEQPCGIVQPRFLAVPGKRTILARSVFIEAAASDAWHEVLIECFLAAPTIHCCVLFQHMGGAVADKAANATAFSARSMEWSVVVVGAWSSCPTGPSRNEQAEQDAKLSEVACKQWVLDTLHHLLNFSVGVYSTDLGANDLELAAYSFGFNSNRLMDLKQRHDPNNMFSDGFPLRSLW